MRLTLTPRAQRNVCSRRGRARTWQTRLNARTTRVTGESSPPLETMEASHRPAHRRRKVRIKWYPLRRWRAPHAARAGARTASSEASTDASLLSSHKKIACADFGACLPMQRLLATVAHKTHPTGVGPRRERFTDPVNPALVPAVNV